MLKLLTNNDDIRDEIKKLFSDAKTIFCAVAFWGSRASELFPRSNRNVVIVCNLLSGGTNPVEVEALRKRFGVSNVLMDNNLHAKVYWTERGVVIGSANASANGLGLQRREGDSWTEAAVFTDDQEVINDVGDWLKSSVRAKAAEIKRVHLNAAHRIWKQRRETRHIDPAGTLLEAIERGTYQDRRLHIVIDAQFLDRKERAEGNEAVEKFRRMFPHLYREKMDFWLNYPKVPREAFVFNFQFTNGAVSFVDTYRTFPRETDVDNYQFCYPVRPEDIPGEMPKQHLDQLIDAVRTLYKGKVSGSGLHETFDKFAKKLLNSSKKN